MTTTIESPTKTALQLLHAPGAVFEIRIIDAPVGRSYRATVAGYFDDPDKAVAAIRQYDGKANIYTTLNPCNPALLARAANRLIQIGKKNPLTSDKDILQRRWLGLDLDYKRPANISASDDELRAALATAAEVENYLTGLGWPEPVRAISGNGGHRCYAIDLPNDDASTALVQNVLNTLALRWPEPVKIDETVFNAARIWKLYGTMAVKGDHIPERPHRRAEIISIPEPVDLVSAELLRAVAPPPAVTISLPPKKTYSRNGNSNGGYYTAEKIEASMTDQEIGFTRKEKDGRTLYILDRCLTSEAHTDGACITFEDGKPGYVCQHDSCKASDWQAVKSILFPNGTAQTVAAAPMGDKTARPKIQTNGRHHRDISSDAYQALLQANEPPMVFVRGGQLARIITDENGRPAAGSIDADSLNHILDRAADFYTLKYVKSQQEFVETPGPLQGAVVRDILAYPSWPELPALVGITTAPTFAASGRLATEAGYNPETQFYYHKNGMRIGDIEPTAANVVAAKKLILEDMLIDFPFVDEASRAHAVAILLAGFVRPVIDGPIPMHLTDAPTIGTGKGLLNHVLTLPFVPEGPDLITAANDPDEWRKRITSSLIKAPSHILIDNISDRLDSADLAAVLTASFWTDRILGRSENITLPARSIWLGTANNVTLSDELTRRSIWIRMDAGMERPWTRRGFAHNNLVEWVKTNRGRIVTACLTLINKWVAEGMKPGPATLGSFERWAATMSGILQAVEIPGFMANTEEMYDRLNTDREPWAAFVAAWWEKHQSKPVGISELYPLASEHDNALPGAVELNLLGDFLDGRNDRGRKTQLGLLLKQKDSAVFDGYKIVPVKHKKNGAKYRLIAPNSTIA